MEAETKVFLVTYGRSDSPTTGMYAAMGYEVESGNLVLYHRGPIATFREGYWLGIEAADSKIKESAMDAPVPPGAGYNGI